MHTSLFYKPNINIMKIYIMFISYFRVRTDQMVFPKAGATIVHLCKYKHTRTAYALMAMRIT